MKILAVEFSTEERSTAVVQSEDGAPPVVLGRALESGGHRALALVEQALKQAGCEREEIETIAVGLGPGSYTGIRGAVGLAQGWQLGRQVNIVGISSVEVLAARASEEGITGAANLIVDAQRNEFYWARYEIAPHVWTETGKLRLATFAEIEELSRGSGQVLGPRAAEFFPSARNFYPDAATLGWLASDRRDFVSGEKLEPIYLREVAFRKAPPSRIVR